jgi:hypothetical protein
MEKLRSLLISMKSFGAAYYKLNLIAYIIAAGK